LTVVNNSLSSVSSWLRKELPLNTLSSLSSSRGNGNSSRVADSSLSVRFNSELRSGSLSGITISRVDDTFHLVLHSSDQVSEDDVNRGEVVNDIGVVLEIRSIGGRLRDSQNGGICRVALVEAYKSAVDVNRSSRRGESDFDGVLDTDGSISRGVVVSEARS
jgi:hypothetical protein